MYNGNSNLFSLMSILLEFPSVGNTIIRHEVHTVTLYRFFGAFGPFRLAVEVIFIICVLVLLVKLVISLIMKKMEYLKNGWHYIEITKVFTGVMAIGYYISRTVLIMFTVEDLKNYPGKCKFW